MDPAGEEWSCSRYPCGHGVSVVMSDVDIMKETVKILPDQEDPGKFLVEFTFDAYVAGSIAFLIYKKVGEDMCSTTEDLPPHNIVEFDQGLSQTFRQNSGTGISLTSHQVGIVDVYHLVLKAQARPGISADGSTNSAQVTVAVFEKAEGECQVSSTRQMLLVNGVQYEWHDIDDFVSEYGCNDSGEECVLCSQNATALPGPHQTVPPPLCMALYDQHHDIATDPAVLEWFGGDNSYRHGVSSIEKAVNIRKETMKIVPDQEDPGKFLVEFTYDVSVTVAGSITLHFGANPLDSDDGLVIYELIPPITLNFQQGLGQKFKQESGRGINPSLYNPSMTRRYYLVIQAQVPPCLSKDGNVRCETTFYQETEAVLEKENDEWQVRDTNQILLNRMVYLWHDIDEFGSDYDSNDPSKKCLHCSLESQEASALPDPHQIVPHLTQDSQHIHEMPENRASLRVSLDARNILCKMGKLSVFDTKIGMGSNGTIVWEGSYDDGREVAVKRIVKEHNLNAVKEIGILIASDWHSNIVRYYGMESDQYFVYIALERCVCSLHDLILLQPTAEVFKDMELWKPNGYPSPDLLRLLRDIVSGVAHLHKLKIIHRDLKPQNVLIQNHTCISAKVSDMGISRCLGVDESSLTNSGSGTVGWQAPERLRKERQRRSGDLFSLGCLLFFCITGGQHPFGDKLKRDSNILKNKKDLSSVKCIPEAYDLISNLLHPDPKSRPTAAEAYNHPFFWEPKTRLEFLGDASDRLQIEASNSNLRKSLENIGGCKTWKNKLDRGLLLDINQHRSYRSNSVYDLLRAIRNIYHHHGTLSATSQRVVGAVPTGLDGYFSSRFPELVMEVYNLMKGCAVEGEPLHEHYKPYQFKV